MAHCICKAVGLHRCGETLLKGTSSDETHRNSSLHKTFSIATALLSASRWAESQSLGAFTANIQ